MSNNYEILDSLTESTAIINKSGEIIYTNKAWRTFSTENRGDDTFTDLNNNYLTVCETTEGEEKKLAMDAKLGIQQVINKELEIFELEYPCHSPTENRWFILRASIVSSNPELTLLVHLNMTNRKIAELKVEKNYSNSIYINKRLNNTLHKIVHDIQNPLVGISNLIKISKSESDIKTIKEYMGIIEEGSTNLNSFVKKTLKHIATSDEIEPVNVNSMVIAYIGTVKQLLISNSINVKLDIKQKEEFYTNPIEFRSILSNLIGNAIKYYDKRKNKKVIVVIFSFDGNNAVLKIKDNGIGIKKESIPMLMEPNYQANKKSSSGEGLGLFIVKRSVNTLNGSIKVKSDFGIGSEFIVELPNGIKKA